MRFWFNFILVIVLSTGVCAVQADIRSVPPGGTVFIGEEQLDISAAGISPGSQIAWWAPGTSLEEVPADIITVSEPARFSAMSSSFSGKEGIWYSLAEKEPVIKIKQPRISIRISDTTSDFDASGKWFPRGHLASFQVETNLYELRSRSGVSGAPVDIIIQSPGGAEYSAVSGPAGSFSLIGIPVSSSQYDTGPVWNTGGTDSGTYSIHAECTANRINSNNGDPGAAVSRTITTLIQDVNPLITDVEKREKENSKALSPLTTMTDDKTTPSSLIIQQTPVRSAQPVSVVGQSTGVDQVSPSVTPPVRRPTVSLSPGIPEVSSSPLAAPSPHETPSTPFYGIIAVIALMCAIIKR